MSEIFQGEFSFSAYMFACKVENVKFFSLHNLRMRHSQYPKGLSMKRNWTSKFGFIAVAHVHCNLLLLSQPLTQQPLNLEHHAIAYFISF